MMNLAWTILTLSLISSCICSVQDDPKVQSSLQALLTPSLCQLKLICAISQGKDRRLKGSEFMRGISALASYRGNLTGPVMLEQAIQTGERGGSCQVVAPACPHSARDLLAAAAELLPGRAGRQRRQVYRQQYHHQPWVHTSHRRQGQGLGRLPPILRPDRAGRRRVCRTCDQRSTVCTVYSVGTYAGCTGLWLVAGLPGQIACNVATAPGSIGCGMNTLHCYMSGCGLIHLPRLP